MNVFVYHKISFIVLSRKFRLCITKAQGKAHTPKDAQAQPKAPSGRELSPKVTEGESVTIKLAQTPSYAGSFRHGYAVPPPSRREAFAKPIIPQIGRENNISAEICKHPYENQPKTAFFFFKFIYDTFKTKKVAPAIKQVPRFVNLI